MAFSIVGFTLTAGATGSEPAGVASGDLLYAWALNETNTTIPSLATSWTNTNTDVNGLICAYRSARIVRGGSAPSFLFSNGTQVGVLAVRGYNSSGTIVEADVAQDKHSTSIASPALSGMTNPSVVVSILMFDSLSRSGTVPSGYTGVLVSSGRMVIACKVVNGTSETPGAWTISGTVEGIDVTTAIPITLATTVTKTATFDAALAAQSNKTATFDAVVAQRQALSATLDAVFATRTSKTATFDMAAAHPTLKTALLDAVMASRPLKTATFDADFMKTQTLTALLDAVMALRQNKTATFDAILAQHPLLTAVFDGVFASVTTKTATFDASTGTPHTKTATFDGQFVGQQFLTATFDALFGYPELLPAGTATVVNSPMRGTATLAHLPPGTATLPKLPPGSAVL